MSPNETVPGNSAPSTPAARVKPWFRWKPFLIFAVVSLGALAPVAWAVREAQESARFLSCSCKLKCISLALTNYQATYGCYPPAYIADPSGKPLHSWRVLLLPYLDEKGLYAEYDFSEPWDGPHNRTLISRMPDIYCCPTAAEHWQGTRALAGCGGLRPGATASGLTSYVGVCGPSAFFRGHETVRDRDITDTHGSTLVLGEAARARIPWTKPEDIDLTMHPRLGDPSGFSSWHPGKFLFAFADGSTRGLTASVPPEKISAGATIDGGELISDNW